MNEKPKKKLKANKKEKKRKRMFGFIVKAVDKVFYTVYDGEPIGGKGGRHRSRSGTILEEEVLFCKNNVCVHCIEKDVNDEKHIPGYICVKKIYKADSVVSDLMLSWTPNTLLKTTDEAEITALETDMVQNADNDSEKEEELREDILIAEEHGKTLESHLSRENFDLPNGSDVFSINLLDMKTVKLFYSGSAKDSGQFVIGSHENEYKVFHFHNTGLIKLTEIFDFWNGCLIDSDLIADEVGQQVYYIRNESKSLSEDGRDLHPEEKRYKAMNMIIWHGFVNQNGQIEDGFNFRKHVFFGGLSQEVRPDAWKYLMYYYPMHSTYKEREVMKEDKKKKYEALHKKRLAFSGEEYELFWRKVQFTVDKDVVRTDRCHPYYAGQDNPNIQKMRNILLNYAVYNPLIGYTQGMSDLVAPVLATLHDEVDSFWCFVGLMEASMFATSPTDDSMDRSLGFLRELLRVIMPEFYMHCLCQDYDLNLLFAHRWLVLCFKREFIFHEVLKIWEACWARYQTDHFHIFICVAIVSLYGDVCLQKKMDGDEILQFFTDMATKFDGSAVLREARAILYKFRQLSRVPCTLKDLLSGKGVWDGGIAPEVECVSHHQRCCYEEDRIDNNPIASSRKEGSEGERSNLATVSSKKDKERAETIKNEDGDKSLRQKTYINAVVETKEDDNLVSENTQNSDISENKTCMEPVASEIEPCRKESDLSDKETIENSEGLKLDKKTQGELNDKNDTRGAVQRI